MMVGYKDQLQTDRTYFRTSDSGEHSRVRGASCSLEFRDWGGIHGVALDTLTYTGDTVVVPKLSKFMLYKSALVDSTLAADSIVSVFVDSMSTTAFGKLDSMDAKMDWLMSDGTAEALINENNKITTVDSLESLWKEVNDLALRYVIRVDSLLDSTNRAKLINIADLCPLYYGPAVYKARALLCSEDNNPRFAWNECERPAIPQPPSMRYAAPDEEEESQEKELRVSVYPNPNIGDLTVLILGGDEESKYSLSILDLLGKQVHSGVLQLGQNEFQLPLSAGTYLYRIDEKNGGLVQQGHVVIIQK